MSRHFRGGIEENRCFNTKKFGIHSCISSVQPSVEAGGKSYDAIVSHPGMVVDVTKKSTDSNRVKYPLFSHKNIPIQTEMEGDSFWKESGQFRGHVGCINQVKNNVRDREKVGTFT